MTDQPSSTNRAPSPHPLAEGGGGWPDTPGEAHPPLTPPPHPSPPPSRCGSATSATPPEGEGALRATRAIPRQATSSVAHVAEPPGDDDPLLAFEPYVHTAPRRNSITPELQREFVASLAATGIVCQAARSIGKSMEALYKLRHRPGAEGFAEAWDAALERGVQRLEDCAMERALQGTPTPIVSGGKMLGTWDKPDNTLLRFLLSQRMPQKYGVQQLTPGHPVYESIRQQVLDDIKAKAPTEAEVLASLNAKLESMRQNEIALKAMFDREEAEKAAKAGGLPGPRPEEWTDWPAS